MRVSALIPARAGSEGLPRKNLAEIDGVSLVEHAIRVAQSVDAIHDVFVSSDDPEVLKEAQAHDATPVHRSTELTLATTPMIEVVDEFLSTRHEITTLVLLQPTSPLRTTEDVEACIDALSSAPAAVTIRRTSHPIEWTFRRDKEGRLNPVFGWEAVVSRRQNAPATYEVNGAVYAVDAQFLRSGGRLVGPETVGVEMPAHRSLDIDSSLDLELARILYVTN